MILCVLIIDQLTEGLEYFTHSAYCRVFSFKVMLHVEGASAYRMHFYSLDFSILSNSFPVVSSINSGQRADEVIGLPLPFQH